MLLDRLFSREESVYLLGRNDLARQLIKKINVIAIVDDFFKASQWEGLQVKKINDIPSGAIVISCSYSVFPVTAIKRIKDHGAQCLTFLELHNDRRFGLTFPFLDDARVDYITHKAQYEALRSSFNDEKSKSVLDNLINFRNTGSFQYMEGFSVDMSGQYFSSLVSFHDHEVFIDAGAFDGQTTREFIKRCPNYKSAYIFEPSSSNLEKAKDNLKDFEHIHFIDKGLSNKKETLRFNSSAGSASSISDDGDVIIEVDSLDNLVSEKVTFIKMDIEGAESLAIEGAKNHILNDHPKMAIAVYHKPYDLWKIHLQVLAIRDDYDLYLRHYTEGTDETIMYFIPNK